MVVVRGESKERRGRERGRKRKRGNLPYLLACLPRPAHLSSWASINIQQNSTGTAWHPIEVMAVRCFCISPCISRTRLSTATFSDSTADRLGSLERMPRDAISNDHPMLPHASLQAISYHTKPPSSYLVSTRVFETLIANLPEWGSIVLPA